jgi:hypothetical protein
MRCVLTPNIEAEIRAIVHESIDLIVEKANAWAAKSYPENFIKGGIELALRAAEAELCTTFTPEFSATIVAEIREIVEAQREAQPHG